jgi:hypothetical protein
LTSTFSTRPPGGYNRAVVYLIDASVYVFRAYYSMPPDMLDRDGNPAHALFGFARFLGDLIERAKPRYIAVAFDESLEKIKPKRIKLDEFLHVDPIRVQEFIELVCIFDDIDAISDRKI